MTRSSMQILLQAVLFGYLFTCSCARPTPSQDSTRTGRASSSAGVSSNSSRAQSVQQRIPVIVDHDGGVEDLVAMMLLALDPRVDLLMVSYLEADSLKGVAVNTTLKLLHFLNTTHIPVAVSTLQPKNPFPLPYRAGPLAADVLPALNPPSLLLASLRRQLVVQQPGQDALTELLLKQEEPVTIVATGPLTNIAYALKNNPAVADKIARIWWMGGTLRHPGNIFNQSNSDGSGEWNVFADPQAAAVVWESKVPVTLVPLDATNRVPITPRLLYRFGEQQRSRLSHLVGAMYAPTVTWVYLSPHDPYYAWDSLNAACFLEPSICKMQPETVSIVLEGKSQGTMVLQQPPGSNRSSSSSSSVSRGKAVAMSKPKQVAAAVDADADKFDAFILNTFKL